MNDVISIRTFSRKSILKNAIDILRNVSLSQQQLREAHIPSLYLGGGIYLKDQNSSTRRKFYKSYFPWMPKIRGGSFFVSFCALFFIYCDTCHSLSILTRYSGRSWKQWGVLDDKTSHIDHIYSKYIHNSTRFMIQICTKYVVMTWFYLILDIINMEVDD